MRFSGGALPQIAFLDLETDGLGRSSKIIIIGILFYKGSCFQLFGNFCNFNNLYFLLRNTKLIVTFNGTSFDLPILERHFNISINKQRHLDLRLFLKKEGIHGGLKDIERKFGINRAYNLKPNEIVSVYNSYVGRGSLEGLKTLLSYNYQDLKSIETIFRYLNLNGYFTFGYW